MSIAPDITPRPARGYADAVERFETLCARDDARIIPEGRSRWLSSGGRTPLAVVLLHGLTNVPEQWVPFATELHARGHTVILPRFPGHGDIDRRGTALVPVRAAAFLQTASDAVDIAVGAGDRVVVAGLSIGGAMAAWLAQRRVDIARCVSIVPFFGVARLGARANAGLVAILDALPDFILPWDPRGSAHESPPYAYPDFPTHALAQCIRIGLDVHATARTRPARGTTAFLLNANEPACNNDLAADVARDFGVARVCDVHIMHGLPSNHDVIDPTNPHARIDVVYPRVRALIEAAAAR